MSDHSKELLQRDGQCIGGISRTVGETGMSFAGQDWELIVSFPPSLNETVMYKIRRHIGDPVRIKVFLTDES